MDTSQPSRYWIELSDRMIDSLQDVDRRARAAGITRRQSYTYDLRDIGYLYETPILVGNDVNEYAIWMERMLRGEAAAFPLPAPVRALMDTDIPSYDKDVPEWGPELSPGATAVFFKFLRLVEHMPFEQYRLFLDNYLQNISTVQNERRLDMTGSETLRWIVEHWHLGDVGCAKALAGTAHEPIPTCRYWIEVFADSSDEVIRRATAAELTTRDSYHDGGFLVGLRAWVGEDPTEVAIRTEQMVRGQAAAIDLPEPLRALLGEEIPPYHEDRYSPGAGALFIKVLRLVEQLPYETYRLVHLYVESLSAVQLEHGIEMTGPETLRWIVDQWDMGDKGAAKHLVERFASGGRSGSPPRGRPTPSETQTRGVDNRIEAADLPPLRWQPGAARRGLDSQSATLPDGSKLTLVRSHRTASTSLFHNGTPVATGTTETMIARATKLAHRGNGGQR